MTDLLLAAVGFLCFQQMGALGLEAARLAGWRGSAGRWALPAALAPVLLGGLGAALILSAHVFGFWSGAAHSSADVDAHVPGAPSPWILGLLGVVVARIALRVVRELALGARLARARAVALPVGVRARVRRLFAEACVRAGAGARPELVLHDDDALREPFLRGLAPARLWLHGEVAQRLSDAHLLAVFLHEIGHRRRLDPWIAWVQSLLVQPLAPGPASRALLAEWRANAEFRCDEFAAVCLGSRRTVAEAIVEVVRRVGPSAATAATPASAGFCGHGEATCARVERLVAAGSGTDVAAPPGASFELRLIGALVLAGVAGVGTLTLLHPEFGLSLFCFFEHVVGAHCIG